MQEFRKRYTGPAAALPGLPVWESELLCARGIDTPEKAEKFLHPGLEDLHDPFAMQDMDRALTLIRMAITRGDRILIYGDYDVDGVSAVTVLLETLTEEGAKVSFRIPQRHGEGYGLNEQAVREIAKEYQLLITVDCGITNVKEVRLAKDLGMTVIVTDHHEVPETLPPADAVLDPLLGNYPFRRLCGAGVALKICQAMQGMAGVEKRLEVTALATVCDIVPLMDENRVIVREGMRRMAETERPGLRALMENARVQTPIHADDLAFRLGPRMNAAGRLEDASQGVALLMTRDEREAKEIADHLEENNRIRQETEQRMIQEAMAALAGQANLQTDRVVILEGEGWNSGVIGLVAGKLCEKLQHPTIILSRQGELAVGSCRSIPGINIWQMLNLCSDLFVRFGGHEQAAGLTIETEKIPEFRRRLNEAIRDNCDDRCFLPVREYDSELGLDDVSLEMVDTLENLEPCGCGNPPPVFMTRDASIQECRRVGKDQSHLKLTLLEGGTLRGGIGFGLGDAADQILERVDVLYHPTRNEFNGRVSPQLQVQAIRSARRETQEREKSSEARFFLDCLQEMTLLGAKKTEHQQRTEGLRPEHLLKERIKRIDPSDEALREVYKALRVSGDALPENAEKLAESIGTTTEQILFALTVFEQTGLARWEPYPFGAELLPFRGKTNLGDNPLVRYLREMQR